MRAPLRTLALALVAAVALGGTAEAKKPKQPAKGGPLRVHTIPPVPGARFQTDHRSFYADQKGVVILPASVVKNATLTSELRDRVKVYDKQLGPNAVARFDRWFGRGTVSFNVFYRLSFTFRDLKGRPVDPSTVSSFMVKSRTGVRHQLKPNQPAWLQGSRVVPFQGILVSKDIDYQTESALVDGNDVVNRAQQRFTPRLTQAFSIRLLFYSIHATSKDAIFGFATGSAIQIIYPSGRIATHALHGGQVRVTGLPRGNYKVKVRANGVSFTRPVSVSRNQEVELKVISWVDMLFTFLVLTGIAGGLLLARRPRLRAKLLRKKAAHA
ncbi:MAG: hypothetical protein ACJ768_23015 [Gaiellaceae bacterium]